MGIDSWVLLTLVFIYEGFLRLDLVISGGGSLPGLTFHNNYLLTQVVLLTYHLYLYHLSEYLAEWLKRSPKERFSALP